MIEVPDFRKLYPHGAVVRDRLGRRLENVHACNPDTGEVIMVERRTTLWQRLTRRLLRSPDWSWLAVGAGIPTRHGFWPAPLVVTPMAASSGFQSVKQRIEQAQGTAASSLTLADLDDLIDAVEAQS
jgi:hypothetical protein